MKKALATLLLIPIASIVNSQCLTFDYSVPTNVCVDERFEITNNISGAELFEWDFCSGDLGSSIANTTTISGSPLADAQHLEFVYDNVSEEWFGFVSDITTRQLIRMRFGSSLQNIPSMENVVLTGDVLTDPRGLEIIQDGSDWYIFMVDDDTNDLLRVSFGNSLLNDGVVAALGDLGSLNRPTDLVIENVNGTFEGLIINGSNDDLTLMRFNNGISNVPIGQVEIVTEFFNSTALSIINDCETWYVIVVNNNSTSTPIQLTFSGGIYDTSFTTDFIDLGGASVGRIFGISLVWEGGNFYGLLDDITDGIYRLDFGASMASASASVDLIGKEGIVNSGRGIDLVSDSSQYYLIIGDVGANQVVMYEFENECDTYPQVSTEVEPSLVYSSSGTNTISLRATDTDGYLSYSSSSVSVESDVAPSASFTPSSSRCVSVSNILTPSTLGLIYTWDFGDGSPTSSDEEPNHNFSTPGTYTIRLDVNDGTCDNFTEQEITIYPDPPTPTFDVTGASLCENVQFDFTNSIDETGYDDVLTYEWSINGQVVSTQRDTTYVFDTPGEKTIGLQAAIPGCESSVVTQTIDIIPTPEAIFDVDTICISESISFLNQSNNASTYNWDFGDGTSSVDFEPTKSYLDSGSYVIVLDAIDASGDCIDTEMRTVRVNRNPPVPSFDLGTTIFCVGSELNVSNLTADSDFNDEVTYEWTVTDVGTGSNRDIDLTFTSTGEKTISLQSFYRTCESAVISQNIIVNDLPAPDFSATPICAGEVLSFGNLSTDAVSFDWDFGNGFGSTDENPEQLFSTAGNYNVSLTATNQFGCQEIVQKEVSVSALPVVSFDFDIPCTSSDGIQFMDLSTVNGASIVSRTWYLGDTPLTEAQNEQNPLLSFATEGTVNVRLEVLSSNGCEASHSEDIQILPAPQPDFAMDIGCEGEISSFTDISTSPGNQVTSWLWTLDGTSYVTQDINHVFSGHGIFEVTLEVTGQNFCSETTTKSIEVLEFLEVEFDVEGDCSNELIALFDRSIALQDPIVSREWLLDGTIVGNGPELILESLPDNTYGIELSITTASGCVISGTENLLINVAPLSSISAPKTFGVPNDAITFTNESTGGSSYHWLLNGDSVSDKAVEETFVFTDAGTYEIGLVSSNDLGCNDTTTTSVFIAVPNVDLAVGQFEIVSNDNIGTIFLEILNNSNLPIDNTEVLIELENQFSVAERIPNLIEAGESAVVSLNVGIPLNSNQLSYLCVTLNSQYKEFDDNNPLDNEKCVAIEPQVVVEAPFPNPVRDQVRVRLVAPNVGFATITLLNSAGKVELVDNPQTQEGLNNFFLDMKALTTGIYFIQIEIAGTTSVQRIIKL